MYISLYIYIEATYICMLWLHSGGSSLKFVEFAWDLSFASPMLPSRKNSGIMNDTQVYIYTQTFILQYCSLVILYACVHIFSQSHMAMANTIVSKKFISR